MMSVRALSTLLLLLASPFASAATYSVGPSGCTHFSLHDALLAARANSNGPHLIKLGSGELLTGGLDLSDPVADIRIEGGYATCAGSAPVAGARMVLRQINPARVLRFSNASDTRRTLELRHVTLTGGNENLSDVLGGGGALVLQHGTLILGAGAVIEGNRAGSGGGVSLLGTPTRKAELILTDEARIQDNEAPGISARGNGGGIYAIDNADIRLVYGSIGRNTSRRTGGGISLATARTRLLIEPHTHPDPAATVAIFLNTSGGETFSPNIGQGGAIYSDEGAVTISAPATNRFSTHIFNNLANMGGAIYAKGGTGPGAPFTFISIRNAVIRENFAEGKGGAFYSSNAVDWVLDHSSPGVPCTSATGLPCSVVMGNAAFNTGSAGTPGGGVGYVTNDAGSSRGIFRFARTLFDDNHDYNGGKAAVAVAYGSSEMQFERCIFRGNQASPTGGGAMLRNAPGIGIRFIYNTVLANDVDVLFHMDGGLLRTQGSIIWSPGVDVWTPLAGATMEHNACMIVHQAGLGATVLAPRLGPTFRPKGGSPAIDHCDNDVVVAGTDLHRAAPGHDVPGVGNIWGANDLGAIENRDILFFSGFGHRPQN